ncbi:hypothetical protein [Nocardioides psychrotolerans]|uniref:hypothetical protein n=1 Tax=Nocardioides psychrotolerans TaxID=1005945 RepID=UPI0031380A8B
MATTTVEEATTCSVSFEGTCAVSSILTSARLATEPALGVGRVQSCGQYGGTVARSATCQRSDKSRDVDSFELDLYTSN